LDVNTNLSGHCGRISTNATCESANHSPKSARFLKSSKRQF